MYSSVGRKVRHQGITADEACSGLGCEKLFW